MLTSGEFDTMRPSIVKTMYDEIHTSDRILFPHSGHLSMIDDVEMMNDVIAEFIKRVQHDKVMKMKKKRNEGFMSKIFKYLN